MKVKKPVLVVILLIAVAMIAAIWALAPAGDTRQPQPANAQKADQPADFDGERAYADVLYQTALGPRTLGSEAHAQTVDWIAASLQAAGWQAEVQDTAFRGQALKNVIGRRTFATGESGGGPWIILGAHYDSRFFADRDPEPARREEPVPGGNDGASGVAVLLELARTLPALAADQGTAQGEVWLVFFDAEDNGSIAGYDWIMGSRAFVQSLDGQPDAAVIVDMIGDEDLNIYYERSS
ncbi:MAG TPA: M28 family peptidase, partial [Anaerolineales bacterium]|nr:M28 family peptidase [Anaerolineales bacterium]